MNATAPRRATRTASRHLAAVTAMLFAAAMGAAAQGTAAQDAAVLGTAAAGPIPAQLEPGQEATVRAVVDGDTVILGDRSQVRLVGLQAPKLPLGRAGFPVWPLAPEAKAALESLTLGKRVRLAFGGRRSDRYRRHLAHLYLGDGTWIQGELLRRGLARVYSFADNRALVAEMLVLERAARRARRGIWAHPFYRIRRVEETPNHIGSFQIVEGRVLKAARTSRRDFLNFGMDWRSDFTISIEAGARRKFTAAGRDLAAFEGRLIRVRGWLKLRNGPMISLTHPEQIEVLDE